MSWLLDPLSQGFMQRAFIAGMLVGGLCACIGVFVVKRGLSFIGDGLAHATFGGIALGLWLELGVQQAVWVALPFTVVVAVKKAIWSGSMVSIAARSARIRIHRCANSEST